MGGLRSEPSSAEGPPPLPLPKPGQIQIEIKEVGAPEVATIQEQTKQVSYEIGQASAGQTSKVATIRVQAKQVSYEIGQMRAGQTSKVGGTSEKTKIEDVKLVATIQEKLKHVTPLSTVTCISRIPRSLRKVNEEAYTTQLVSIGPYHHGIERLKAMEEHKIRYLSDFFDRSPRHSLADFVQSLRELEESARQCYGNPVEGDSNMFVEMMLLDGCFIMELFFKFWQHNREVVTSDPLFHIASTMITTSRHATT